jgi:hypothetical protein
MAALLTRIGGDETLRSVSIGRSWQRRRAEDQRMRGRPAAAGSLALALARIGR